MLKVSSRRGFCLPGVSLLGGKRYTLVTGKEFDFTSSRISSWERDLLSSAYTVPLEVLRESSGVEMTFRPERVERLSKTLLCDSVEARIRREPFLILDTSGSRVFKRRFKSLLIAMILWSVIGTEVQERRKKYIGKETSNGVPGGRSRADWEFVLRERR